MQVSSSLNRRSSSSENFHRVLNPSMKSQRSHSLPRRFFFLFSSSIVVLFIELRQQDLVFKSTAFQFLPTPIKLILSSLNIHEFHSRTLPSTRIPLTAGTLSSFPKAIWTPSQPWTYSYRQPSLNQCLFTRQFVKRSQTFYNLLDQSNQYRC
jgi:hypothetical protein